ncbi:hypothetical protein D3093_34815 (plasmid) [Azospirillum argentinense]|uniref:Uncharacterized protein n=1 Tax=Azospirillum argentinense TaxID=2970906 RepID=A0A4D8PUD1_9PROT|nr:hypothetical protein D3093_34815 [Azospirillum argentinense]
MIHCRGWTFWNLLAVVLVILLPLATKEMSPPAPVMLSWVPQDAFSSEHQRSSCVPKDIAKFSEPSADSCVVTAVETCAKSLISSGRRRSFLPLKPSPVKRTAWKVVVGAWPQTVSRP